MVRRLTICLKPRKRRLAGIKNVKRQSLFSPEASGSISVSILFWLAKDSPPRIPEIPSEDRQLDHYEQDHR